MRLFLSNPDNFESKKIILFPSETEDSQKLAEPPVSQPFMPPPFANTVLHPAQMFNPYSLPPGQRKKLLGQHPVFQPNFQTHPSFYAPPSQVFQTPIHMSPAVKSTEKRPMYGTKYFSNGAQLSGLFHQGYSGNFQPLGGQGQSESADYFIDGEGTLSLPDDSSFKGFFERNSFVRGTVTYFGKVSIKATFKAIEDGGDREALDDFLLTFEGGWTVKGKTDPLGVLESAQVRNFQGHLVGVFEGKKLKLEPVGGFFLVITRSWVYAGELRQYMLPCGRLSEAIEFGENGVQIWVKGFGYFRLEEKAGRQVKTLLRIYKGVSVFRESVEGEAGVEVTVFGCGFIFAKKRDRERGSLIVLRGGTVPLCFDAELRDPVVVNGRLLGVPGLGDIEMESLGDGRIVFKLGHRELRINELLALIQSSPKNLI